MTTRSTRSLVLSIGIALLITATYYWLLNETPYVKKAKKILHYNAAINIRLEAPGNAAASTADVQNSLGIIGERLTQAQYKYNLKPERDKTFTFSIDKLTDTTAPEALLTGNGHLAMREVHTLPTFFTSFGLADTALAEYFLANPKDTMLHQNGGAVLHAYQSPILSVLNTARPYNGGSYPGYIGIVAIKDTALLRQLLEHPVAAKYWPADNRFLFGENDDPTITASQLLLVYAIKNHPPRITNRNIILAQADYDEMGGATVRMDFDPYGATEWERMTTRNVGKQIAICLNDKVMSAPTVNQPIIGGSSRISLGGDGAREYSKMLSILLMSKELPLQVKINYTHITPAEKPVSPVLTYVLLFILSFGLALGVQWLIFRLNKI
jgi:hypothetical protein